MSTSTSTTLNFDWPQTINADMRTFKVYWNTEDSTAEPIELYRFYHPVTGLTTGLTTFSRQNLNTSVFETAGQIDWSNNMNCSVSFGVDPPIHIRELRKPKKSSSRSRRFKAGGSEYKWKVLDNDADLLCVDSRGRTIATWTQNELQLVVSPRGQDIMDRVVVTCFLNLWIRHLGHW